MSRDADYERTVRLIATNPAINDDEARRVLRAVSQHARTTGVSRDFIQIVLGDEVLGGGAEKEAAAGNNACGGGSNACAS